MGRIAPIYYVQDSVIPRKLHAEENRRIDELADYLGVAVANVYHAADANLHPLDAYDATVPGEK